MGRTADRTRTSVGPLAALLLALSINAGCTAVPALVQCRKADASLRGLEDLALHVPERGESGVSSLPEVSYELALARAYLEKAREEASEARYGLAAQLAKRSQQASARGRGVLAGQRRRL